MVGVSKENPTKTTTESMRVDFSVHYLNTLFKVSCRTRALQNQRLNSCWRAGFLAHRVCHADGEETGEHSGSETVTVSAEEAEKGLGVNGCRLVQLWRKIDDELT